MIIVWIDYSQWYASKLALQGGEKPDLQYLPISMVLILQDTNGMSQNDEFGRDVQN